MRFSVSCVDSFVNTGDYTEYMYKDLVERLVQDGLGICTSQYKELLLLFFFKHHCVSMVVRKTLYFSKSWKRMRKICDSI